MGRDGSQAAGDHDRARGSTRGLTLAQLADRVGLSNKSAVGHYEAGRQLPKLATAIQLNEVLCGAFEDDPWFVTKVRFDRRAMKAAREARHLSCAAMADQLELAPSTVERAERGDVDPDVTTIELLESALGHPSSQVSPDYTAVRIAADRAARQEYQELRGELAATRRELKVRANHLAEAIGLEHVTIRRLERGEFSPADVAVRLLHSALTACERLVVSRARFSGDALRAARESLGLSVKAVGRLSGTDPSTIDRIERGLFQPSPRSRAKIEAALNADPETLALERTCVERGSFEHLRDIVPWSDDPISRYAVAMHPDGMTGEQVGEVLHLAPSAVDLAQANALAKLRDLANRDTPEGEEVRRWFELIGERREEIDSREPVMSDGERW